MVIQRSLPFIQRERERQRADPDCVDREGEEGLQYNLSESGNERELDPFSCRPSPVFGSGLGRMCVVATLQAQATN